MKFYDKTYRKARRGGDYVEFVGERMEKKTIRNGHEVEPYEHLDTDTVTVQLPTINPFKPAPAMEPATVNWTAMGSREPECAAAYAVLIARAARFAMKKNAEAGVPTA